MWEGLRDRFAEGYTALVGGGDDAYDDGEWNPLTERRLKLLLRQLKTLKVLFLSSLFPSLPLFPFCLSKPASDLRFVSQPRAHKDL